MPSTPDHTLDSAFPRGSTNELIWVALLDLGPDET